MGMTLAIATAVYALIGIAIALMAWQGEWSRWEAKHAVLTLAVVVGWPCLAWRAMRKYKAKRTESE